MNNARDLSNRLASLLRDERRAMADFLLALADFDRMKLWRDLGHVSLFAYLRRELRLSAGAAQYRKTAAELIQQYPEVEAALREGELCLSSVVELAKVLTRENVADVLPRFFGLSSRDAAAVAVSIRPIESPPSREVLVPLAPAPTQPASSAEPAAAGSSFELRAPEPREVQAAPPAWARTDRHARPAIEPLDAAQARLHLTVSRRFLAKLQAARTHSRTPARARAARRSSRPVSTSSSHSTRSAAASSRSRATQRDRRRPTPSPPT